jgi:hypothetical protein
MVMTKTVQAISPITIQPTILYTHSVEVLVLRFAEAASLSTFFELFAGDIDDDILEVVDENDLSFDPVIAKYRSQMVFLRKRDIGDADIHQAAAIDQFLDGACHYFRTQYKVFLTAVFSSGKPITISGRPSMIMVSRPLSAQIILVIVKSQQQLFGLFLEQVHQDQVVGERREMTDGIPADIGCLRVIKGREFMEMSRMRKSGLICVNWPLTAPTR